MDRTQEVAWMGNLWSMLNDRGTWGVPRTGLVFQKREAERQFVLVAREPYDPTLRTTTADFRAEQDYDIDGIRSRFAELDVEVLTSEPLGADEAPSAGASAPEQPTQEGPNQGPS